MDVTASLAAILAWTKLTELSLYEVLMTTVNIHEAKTQLSRLVAEAAKGKPFIIAKAGKPLVKVTALDTPTSKQARRLGFLRGHLSVPDDFNSMGRLEIEQLFGGGE
jgi:prevent-host-death family protein